MFKHAPHVLLAMVCVAGSATIATAQGHSNVQSVPNATKYKNAGVKPATGRSGSASLEARVMIGKDGKMLVETSTGSVEQAGGPGNLSKVQVKFGELTQNFNNLTAGGYFSAQFPAVGRGTPIQVQGNVRGIDPKRTDVVTVTTPAALRPDLAVDSVTGPAEQMPNAPATFTATLTETNGDLGALANCVLSVDGTQVDVAPGIWVDAGDSVNCQFSRSFEQPGTYTISVSAADVTPGDWDTANNQAQTTITIVEPSKTITSGSLQASQEKSKQYSYYENDYYSSYYGWYTYYGERWSNRNLSEVALKGSRQGGASLMQDVTATINVNGSTAHQVTLSPNRQTTFDNGSSYNACMEYYYDYWTGSGYARSADRAQMCSGGVHGNPNSKWTNYSYTRNTGTVTYYGYDGYCGYYYSWWGGYYYWSCYAYYSWNNQDTYGNGISSNWTPNTQVQVKVSFVDDSAVSHTADRSVTLQDVSHEVNYSGEWHGWYSYQRWQSNGTRYRGRITWNDPQ